MTPAKGARRPAPESATARLTRLLTMVPWLLNRQGIDTERAAAELGVTVEQLESDLSLLFVCGYGQMPDELIEAEWEEGRVFLSNADTIARPLRLGVDEAATLIVGLRALREVSAISDTGLIDRTLAKLEAAAGAVAGPVSRIEASIDDSGIASVLGTLREAVASSRRVHLTYHVPGRDETTRRDVDPMRVIGMDGHWYLEGWCHLASDTRLFRLDRIVDLAVLDIDGTPPEGAAMRDLTEGTYRPAPGDVTVTLRLLPGARWVADYYPVSSVTEVAEDEGGGSVVTLRTSDTQWLQRLLRRLGGRGIVVAPSDVAEEVRLGADAALAGYVGKG